ncbi:unnamed protein product [Amaranthus hypochondriacus]
MASSSATSTNPILPKFSGKNYEHWNVQMKVIFKYNDVWEIVEKGHIEPTEQEEATMTDAQKKKLNETRKKDLKALSFIHSAMDGQNMFEKLQQQRHHTKLGIFLTKYTKVILVLKMLSYNI